MSYPVEFANHFIGVGGIVIDEEKVLLVQLTYGRTKGNWLIPGGFIESGETLQEGVRREVFEETGVQVEPEGIIGVRSMVRSDNLTDLYCVLICKLISKPSLLSPQTQEIARAAWIPLNQIQEDPKVLHYTKLIIDKALHLKPMVLGKPLSKNYMKRLDLKKYEHFWVQ
ncbi:MAG: NUDIX domain-containing protein [Candidatus Hodarchaeales archaeon]|jgi:ADP-ribose pyrophosphatase YjhB (NUDIX family)